MTTSRWVAPWMWMVAGCAPAYRPPAPFVPILLERGDLVAAGHVGTGGTQVDLADAPTDHVTVRGGAQYAGFSTAGTYAVGTLGLGAYGSAGHAFGWAVNAVAGTGYTRGITTVQLHVTPTTGTGGGVASTYRTSGPLVTAAVRSEFGLRSEHAAIGVQVGPTFHQVWHDGKSDQDGVGQAALLEAAGVARAGPGPITFEASIGLLYPLWVNRPDAVGVPMPLILGIGVVADLR